MMPCFTPTRPRLGSNRMMCVKLLHNMDRIYVDPEHPMTEIDVDAVLTQKYGGTDLCQGGRADGRTVEMIYHIYVRNN